MAPLGETTPSYLDGLLTLWRADRNPLWIWHVIKTCIENGDSFPADAIEYLNGVAGRLLSDDEARGRDVRKNLRSILGFQPQAGRAGHALKVGRKMVNDEKFCVRFAAQILDGRDPFDARTRAWREKKVPEDRTLQTKVHKFFKVDRAPSGNAGWRKIIIRWMTVNWNYRTRYPELPPLTPELINEVIDELPRIPSAITSIGIGKPVPLAVDFTDGLPGELEFSSRPNCVNSPRADATPGVSSNAMVSHAKKITRPRRP